MCDLSLSGFEILLVGLVLLVLVLLFLVFSKKRDLLGEGRRSSPMLNSMNSNII
jgi:hypothetical protein